MRIDEFSSGKIIVCVKIVDIISLNSRGMLYYIRTPYQDYDLNIGDELDDQIAVECYNLFRYHEGKVHVTRKHVYSKDELNDYVATYLGYRNKKKMVLSIYSKPVSDHPTPQKKELVVRYSIIDDELKESVDFFFSERELKIYTNSDKAKLFYDSIEEI